MKDVAHHLKRVQKKVIQTQNKNGNEYPVDKNTPIHEIPMASRKNLSNPRSPVTEKRLPVY